MERSDTTKSRLGGPGGVNLTDLRYSVSQTRTHFTRLRGGVKTQGGAAGPKADFITFVALASEIYRGQDGDLVPVQQYPSALETHQGKGHTSLVSHASISRISHSGFTTGTGTYEEGIIIKRPRHSILEEQSSELVSFLTDLRIRSHPQLRTHTHITRLRGVGWDFEDEESTIPRPILLEEFAPQGALDNFWKNWSFARMTFKSKLQFCRDIAAGLTALHSYGVVHGDVKPENILVFPRVRDSFMVKLTDFGHSVLEVDQLTTLPAFTPQWCAPELTRTESMTFKDMKATDCYSYGLVALSIMIGRAFHNGFEDLEQSKQDGSILPKSTELLEREDKENNDSDLEIGTVASLLRETLQVAPHRRSIANCIEIIQRYEWDNQGPNRASNVKPMASTTSRIRVGPLNVTEKVAIGYQTLSRCSHQLKAHIVEKLRLIANNPKDPRKPAAEWELAICYFSGFGVSRNLEFSSHWLALARSHGIVAAQTYIKPLYEAMQLEKGKKPDEMPFEVFEKTESLVFNEEEEISALDVENSQTSALGLDCGAPIANLTPVLNVQDNEIPEDTTLLMTPPLRAACCNAGSLNDLQRLLEDHPASVNSQDVDGNTPLLLAAKYARSEILEFLLSLPDTDARINNNSGETVLHYLAAVNESEFLKSIVPTLILKGADMNQEAMPACHDSERFSFSLRVRSCPLLNAILSNNTALLECLLEASHSDGASNSSTCRICETGSRFRRIFAISFSLFQADAVDILASHLQTYRPNHSVDLGRIDVWAGRELLPLYTVPFNSVAIAAMDLPESFFRAMAYGEKHTDVLVRTIKFLLANSNGDKEANLPYKMLRAAVQADNLDAINIIFQEAKKQDLPVHWYFENDEIFEGAPVILSIRLGMRDIFNRLLQEDDTIFRRRLRLPCDNSLYCRGELTPWARWLRSVVGGEISRSDHTHSFNFASVAVRSAITSRHQDGYFLDTILDIADSKLILKDLASYFHQSVLASNFKAASILAAKFPEVWDATCFWPPRHLPTQVYIRNSPFSPPFQPRDPTVGTTAELILYAGSYEQCQFVLKHLSASRSTSVPWEITFGRIGWFMLSWNRKKVGHAIDDGVPEWQKCPLKAREYDALLSGNIKRNRADRRVLWNVVSAQISAGRSTSVKYLHRALENANAEALQELLDRGWRANGSPWAFFQRPLQYTHELLGLQAFVVSEALTMEMDNDSGQLLRPQAKLNTRGGIYGLYRANRDRLLTKLRREKLERCAEILQNAGGRVSPLAKMAFTIKTGTRAVLLALYILVYAIILPLILVYATQSVWISMSIGHKFGFVYLWAGLSFFFPLFTILRRGSRKWKQFGTSIWYCACAVTFLINHFLIPILIIHINWQPFLSCQYSVEDCRLVSSCRDFSFLFPLAAAGIELILGGAITLFLYDF